MFDHEDPRHRPLMSAIDRLNNKYSTKKLKLANQDLKRLGKCAKPTCPLDTQLI